MPTTPFSLVLRRFRAATERAGAGGTDGELLTRFLSQRDNDALAALVHRHAPMVWGVCRRLLRSPQDAEDALQATFLVLVRKAATVLPREMVGNWLYGVAHQTAVRLRVTAARRGLRETQMRDTPEPAMAEAADNDLLHLLDQELSCLPLKYRVMVVLCDLESKTRVEVARQLGIPEGTVASRLARARGMLAKRLARHGLAVSGASLAASLSQTAASATVPPALISSTINAATLLAAGRAAATGAISVRAAALADGMVKAMMLTKLKLITVLLLVAVLSATAGLIYQTRGAEQPIKLPVLARDKQAASKVSSEAKPQPALAGNRLFLPGGGAEKAKQPAPKQPKTFVLKVQSIKAAADQKSEISFYLDKYYAEFDDRGVPRGRPLAREVDILIDGKKARLTDLSPGDLVAVQLSPDNQTITRIEFSLRALKTRLNALEQEAATIRQRLQRLEKTQ